MKEQFRETIDFLTNEGIKDVDAGIVLGTGLSNFLEHIKAFRSIPYSEIPHFPVSTVESHKGNLVYAQVGKLKVLIMHGRFHYYEGYNMQQIVYPVRIMKLMGAKMLFLSNAAGGINTDFKKGDLVLIDDHINFQTSNPLTGKNIDELGPRFPDMSAPYSAKLNKALTDMAAEMDIILKKGVYASVTGPNLETRAEYRFLKLIGADMVGMSTVPEVITANHADLPCAAVSVITDECDPDNLQPVSIEEIIAVAGKSDCILSSLMAKTLEAM